MTILVPFALVARGSSSDYSDSWHEYWWFDTHDFVCNTVINLKAQFNMFSNEEVTLCTPSILIFCPHKLYKPKVCVQKKTGQCSEKENPWFGSKGIIYRQLYLTDAIIISFPAPAEPPITATIKLGTIAKHLVKKFRSHGFSRKFRKPFNKK